MFYCEPCRVKAEWPQSFMKSYGKCEMCKRTDVCHDVPSMALPKPKAFPYKGRHIKED